MTGEAWIKLYGVEKTGKRSDQSEQGEAGVCGDKDENHDE
jgi:hypothetical protein